MAIIAVVNTPLQKVVYFHVHKTESTLREVVPFVVREAVTRLREVSHDWLYARGVLILRELTRWYRIRNMAMTKKKKKRTFHRRQIRRERCRRLKPSAASAARTRQWTVDCGSCSSSSRRRNVPRKPAAKSQKSRGEVSIAGNSRHTPVAPVRKMLSKEAGRWDVK